MTTHLPVITQSELRTYRRCAREWRLAYGLGIRPAGADAAPLRFGSAVHAGLEMWWRGQDGWLDALNHLADPWEHAMAAALLAGYDAYWKAPAGEVLGVEVEFRAPLTNPQTGADSRTFQLGGKVDALTRLDGRVLLVEHKTTSEDIAPGSDYWRRLRIDTQVSLYYAGVRSLGHDPAGCLYDVIRKPGLRPRKGDTPEAYYERLCDELASNPGRYYQQQEVVRLESEEREALIDAWQTARGIREGDLAHRWPRNADACVRWGRTCSYFGVCTGMADPNDSSRFRRLSNPHPELTPEAP